MRPVEERWIDCIVDLEDTACKLEQRRVFKATARFFEEGVGHIQFVAGVGAIAAARKCAACARDDRVVDCTTVDLNVVAARALA